MQKFQGGGVYFHHYICSSIYLHYIYSFAELDLLLENVSQVIDLAHWSHTKILKVLRRLSYGFFVICNIVKYILKQSNAKNKVHLKTP